MLSRLFCAALQCCSISHVFGVTIASSSIAHGDLRQKTGLPAPPPRAARLELPVLCAAKLPPSVSPRNLRPWCSQTETISGERRRQVLFGGYETPYVLNDVRRGNRTYVARVDVVGRVARHALKWRRRLSFDDDVHVRDWCPARDAGTANAPGPPRIGLRDVAGRAPRAFVKNAPGRAPLPNAPRRRGQDAPGFGGGRRHARHALPRGPRAQQHQDRRPGRERRERARPRVRRRAIAAPPDRDGGVRRNLSCSGAASRARGRGRGLCGNQNFTARSS